MFNVQKISQKELHQLSAAEHLWEHQLVGMELSDNNVVLLSLQGVQAIRQDLEPVWGSG